jgi:hypothetical protein
MPTVKNPTLKLITTNDTVKIKVEYDADFTDFDVQLARLGLVFDEHIAVIDDDGDAGQNILATVSFPSLDFEFDDKKLGQTIHRTVEPLKVSRKDLDVDDGDDEIKCRIRIHAKNMTPALTEDVFTSSELLLGDVKA